jgi:hypothetical protein
MIFYLIEITLVCLVQPESHILSNQKKQYKHDNILGLINSKGHIVDYLEGTEINKTV